MPHTKKGTTKLITVLEVVRAGKSGAVPNWTIVDAEGKRYHTKDKSDAGWYLTTVEGDALAGEQMRLHLNGAGKVTAADWGELL